MTLLATLIRKRDTRQLATAIPAIAATQQEQASGTVAKIATIAVANPICGTAPDLPSTVAEAAEIKALVMAGFSGGSEVDHIEALALALADPSAALLCYRELAEEPGIVLAATDDDRRQCSQCLNLRGRICTIARPGGLVSARRGYEPMRDTLHRCAGYHPDSNDSDQRMGEKRWPGLIAKGNIHENH